MSGARISAAVAWSGALVVMVFVLAATGLRYSADAGAWISLLEVGMPLPVGAGVGAIIVSRRPRNVVGWLLILVATSWAAQDLGAAYTRHAIASGADAVGAVLWAAWVGDHGWVFAFPVAFIILPLLYPDGRPPSPRWRPVVVLAVALTAVTPFQALVPGMVEIDGIPVGPNPAALGEPSPSIARATDIAIAVLFVPLLACAVAAVVVRFRRSRGVERQQIKWLVAPFGLIPVVLVLTMFPSTERIGQGFGGLVLMAIFGGIGVAVLRYRLYEIDRIVSRTVSYGVLTLLLVGVYAVGVVGLGGILRSVGGGSGSDLVVAASTLAVAALFQPLRRRVGSLVDRRFDRSRYDAQRTVETFAQHLREEVELDSLLEEVRAATTATLRPAFTSVWLSPRRVRR